MHTGTVMKNLGLALGLALAACGSSAQPGSTVPAPGAAAAATDDPTCPVLVAGTSVTVEDTDQGAALVFVTTGDIDAVRTRARALAEMHNAHHANMAPPAGAADPHAGHAGHAAASGSADPHAGHAGHAAASGSADPHAGHAGHAAASGSADPHAGHAGHAAASGSADPHAGHAGHAGHAAASGTADPHAGHAGHGGGPMGKMIGHSTAEVTEVPNGARVAFTGHDPAALQSELRMHAQHLGNGTCEM
ncbi:MAG: hypothetical protein ACTHU0_22530 [Kofleriaceae bacterium]